MTDTPFPAMTLAVYHADGSNRAVRIAAENDDGTRAVHFGSSTEPATVAVGELRVFKLADLESLAAADAVAAKDVLVRTVATAFTQRIRTTPYTSAATVAMRALNLDIFSLPRVARFVAEYAVDAAAGGDDTMASEVHCAIAEALLMVAADPSATIEAVACLAWCAETCTRVGENAEPASVNYIDPAQANKEH